MSFDIDVAALHQVLHVYLVYALQKFSSPVGHYWDCHSVYKVLWLDVQSSRYSTIYTTSALNMLSTIFISWT